MMNNQHSNRISTLYQTIEVSAYKYVYTYVCEQCGYCGTVFLKLISTIIMFDMSNTVGTGTCAFF